MNKLKERAEKLRAEGYSYAMIRDKLGVSLGTMSYWFKDKPFTPNQEVLDRIKGGTGAYGVQRHNKRVKEIAVLREEGIAELGPLSKRDLWLLGIGLYIGEGSKTTEMIRIVNSDPAVIQLAIRWLKDACGLDDENITISLHLYPDNDIEKSKDYWQKVTCLPRDNFRWVSIDRRDDKRRAAKGKLPFGTAHVTVRANGDPEKGVRLFRKINGWIAGALKSGIINEV
jgi:hypothetical protein